jgi:hypothetical protein
VKGSIRQRGTSSFELRVYVGTDPDTGKRRWITRTVRGTRSDAQRELKVLAAHANVAPAVGSHTTVAELLDQWFARGRTGWSPTTVRILLRASLSGCPTPVLPFRNGSSEEEIDLDAPGARFEDRVGGGG